MKKVEKQRVEAPLAKWEVAIPGLAEAVALLRETYPLLSDASIAVILGLPLTENETSAVAHSVEVPE